MPTSSELMAALNKRKRLSVAKSKPPSSKPPSSKPPSFKPSAFNADTKSTHQARARPRPRNRGSIVHFTETKRTDEKGRIDFLDNLRKRTKNRRKAKYISRNKNLIKQLLGDMTSKVKFGKMLSYSLTCLTNLCVDEVSCEELIDSDVLAVIDKVLKKNPYNESLQRLVNNFIQKVSINPAMAKLVAQKLSGTSLSASLKNHLDNETMVSTMDTITQVVDSNLAKKLQGQGMLQSLSHVLNRNNLEQSESDTKDAKVASAAAKMCKKLVTVRPELSEALESEGVTDELLEAMKLHPENEDVALNTFETIRLMVEHKPSLGAKLKAKGVVQILVSCLEKNPDNKILLASGSQALKVLGTSGELEYALKKLHADGEADGGLMATIGALSLVNKNVEFLIKNGGIALITGHLRKIAENESFDVSKDANAKRFLINGLRALERMAIDEQNIYQLMQEGTAQVILATVRKCYQDPEVVAAGYSALAQFSSRPENAQYLVQLGTLASVVSIAQSLGLTDANVAKKATKLLASLCLTPQIATQILTQGLPQAVRMLVAHEKDPGVLLEHLLLAENLTKHLGDAALAHIAANGGIEAIVKGLKLHGKDPEVATKALVFLEKACKNAECLKRIKAAGALPEVLNMMDIHKENGKLAALAARVAGQLVTEDDVKNYMSQVEALLKRVQKGDKTAIPELVKLTNLLSGLAAVEQNRKLMAKCGILETLSTALDTVRMLPDSPEKDMVIRNLVRTAANISENPEVAELLIKAGLHQTILTLALKGDDEEVAQLTAKMFRNLACNIQNIHMMEKDGTLAQISKLDDKFQDADGVSADLSALFKTVSKLKGGNIEEVIGLTLSALEGHTDTDKVIEDLQYLISLTSQQKALNAMLKLGTAKVAVAAIQENSWNAKAQEAAVLLLHKLADSNDPQLLLSFCEKGGVDIICRAMKKLFNVPKAVEDNMVLLARVAGDEKLLRFFVKNGLANTKLALWAAKAYPNNKKIQEAANIILKAANAYQQGQYLIKKQEDERLALIAKQKLEEKMKLAGNVTVDDLSFMIQGLDSNNLDASSFDELIAIIGNPDHASMFVDAGGLDFMKNVILQGNCDDDVFRSAVICFDKALGSLDSKHIDLLGDKQMMDMMMKIMDPKRVATLEWDQLGNTMQAMVTMTEDGDILAQMLKKGDLKGALMAIASLGQDINCLIPAMKMLARISNNKDEMAKFANPENIKHLLEAMRKHIKQGEFIQYSCYLLGSLALNQHVQNMIGELGAIQVLAQVLTEHRDDIDVTEKAAFALRMLSVKNAVNCGLIVRYDVYKQILEAMGRIEEMTGSADRGRFWVNTLGFLLNLTKQGAQYVQTLHKSEAALRIIEVVYSNTDNDIVVKFCCRVLERLVTKNTYRSILEESVIHCINPALNRETVDSVVAAVKVFNRLAQYSRADKDAMFIIIREKAHRAVVSCISQHKTNAAIMGPAVECLTHMAYENECSLAIVRGGVLEELRDSLTSLSYDENFCTAAINLFDRLTIAQSNLKAIVESKIMEEVCEIADTYINSQPIVIRFLSSMRRICSQSNYAVRLRGLVMPLVIKITSEFLEESAILLECFNSMKSLTLSNETARPLAKPSCQLALKAMKQHFRHGQLQRRVLEFLSSLFLQEHACEDATINTPILEFLVTKLTGSDESLLMCALDALYHMATSTNKVKAVMKSKRVIDDLKEMQTRCADNKDIVTECGRVINAILTNKISAEDLNFKQATVEFVDTATLWKEEKKQTGAGYTISAKLKNFLVAGMEIKWHKNKSVVDTHLQVSRNLKKITWTQGIGGAAQGMGVWRMRRAKTGMKASNEFAKKSGYKTKTAVENRAFVIIGEDAAIAIECPTEAMRNKWVKALDALKRHDKENKKLATDYIKEFMK